MNKLTLLLLAVLLISCERSKEEQMFYDFMDGITIKSVNMSIKDLDFKIISLNKVGLVAAKDSIFILEPLLDELRVKIEEQKTSIEKDLDELYKYNLDKNKTKRKEAISIYQNLIDLTNGKIEDRQEVLGIYTPKFAKTSSKLDEYRLDSTRVISTKYEVTYSMHMPDTDLTNTIKVYAYTNEDNSKFLGIE
ncbi:hypothetical protein [Maribacter sp. ACAM166]|uniref:hypothetical protein n=1 Tax=Maribacter sp. ACAM166 TaxID=2508996 RepID=UPI0010FE0109|nr:hypothetical protein [Maribacter sp. ACAM166]TLP80926.1 hypothetical protein ES765_05625 [Maribacter sp. ACAM166]